jgi:hypothetical protein
VVTVSSAVAADDLTINGQVTINGGTFTIAAGGATVNGDLVVSGTTTSVLNKIGALTFGSGGRFVWNAADAPTIPSATWANGSTCLIQNGPTGTAYSVTNMAGQSFYNFAWDYLSQIKTADLVINSPTTVRGNLVITNGKTVCLNNTGPTAGMLTVNGDVIIDSAAGTKVALVGPATGTWDETLVLKGNFIVGGAGNGLDSTSPNNQSHFIFDGSGLQTVSINPAATNSNPAGPRGRSTALHPSSSCRSSILASAPSP